MDEINNQETLADGVDVASADGGGNDSEVVKLKDLLSEALGRQFPTDEAALKSVKDTQAYVGKVGKVKPLIEQLEAKYGGEAKVLEMLKNMTESNPQETAKQTDSNFVSKQQYETDNYFSQHPELQPYREMLEALGAKNGKTMAEAAELPAFKGVFEKAKNYDDQQKSKSVLHTNPRIGQVTDKLSKAREAIKGGDYDTAKANAVGAVLDAMQD